MNKSLLIAVCAGLTAGSVLVAQDHLKHGPAKTTSGEKAVAVLHPTKGNTTSGIVWFESVKGGMKVTAHLSGLTPGKHGFHIHEYGDCTADDAISAGGHFNPTNMPHSSPSSGKRHVGDLGNIEADKGGNAHLEYVDPMLSFSGPNSIIGRGVIVHEKADDLKTQPTGDAGGRLACGVVGVAK
ncbi:MAG: superoxide dismutase family protein [Ignavibacterium sp.]|jgi:Cu-Zn family superoxide dismutase